jgi:endonuclease G
MYFPKLLHAHSNLLLTYNHFELLFNPFEKVAVAWSYTLDKNNFGHSKRPNNYYHDPNLSIKYQQKSLRSYRLGKTGGIVYDRGHLVTSYHMNTDYLTRHQAHYMTNILPQASKLNQGIISYTEKMTYIASKINPVTVIGGVIFNDSSNDYFMESHNIKTPDYFYKILITDNNTRIISWLIPNTDILKPLVMYIVSVDTILKELQVNNYSSKHLDHISNELKDITACCNWIYM